MTILQKKWQNVENVLVFLTRGVEYKGNATLGPTVSDPRILVSSDDKGKTIFLVLTK